MKIITRFKITEPRPFPPELIQLLQNALQAKYEKFDKRRGEKLGPIFRLEGRAYSPESLEQSISAALNVPVKITVLSVTSEYL